MRATRRSVCGTSRRCSRAASELRECVEGGEHRLCGRRARVPVEDGSLELAGFVDASIRVLGKRNGVAGPRDRVHGRVASHTTREPVKWKESCSVWCSWNELGLEDCEVEGSIPVEGWDDPSKAPLIMAGSMSDSEKRRRRPEGCFWPGMTVLEAFGGGKGSKEGGPEGLK